MKLSSIIAFLIGLLYPFAGEAFQIYDDFPKEIDASERYVIYSHNLVVEGDDERPIHPEFGVSDFPAVKQALFNGGNFNLIAHHRPKNTAISSYVDQLESWVRRLIVHGVKPSHIALVGFSRGAQLTAFASARLQSAGINTALLAACTDGDIRHDPPLVFGGNFLSIYETSDVVGNCAKLAARSHRVL